MHVMIQASGNSGSSFFNYKGMHSVVVLAVCNVEAMMVLVEDQDCHSFTLLPSSIYVQICHKEISICADTLQWTFHPAEISYEHDMIQRDNCSLG